MAFLEESKERLLQTEFSFSDVLLQIRGHEQEMDVLGKIAKKFAESEVRNWGENVADSITAEAVKIESIVRCLMARYGEKASLSYIDMEEVRRLSLPVTRYVSPINSKISFTDINLFETHIEEIKDQLTDLWLFAMRQTIAEARVEKKVIETTKEYHKVCEALLTQQASQFLDDLSPNEHLVLERELEPIIESKSLELAKLCLSGKSATTRELHDQIQEIKEYVINTTSEVRDFLKKILSL